MQVICAHCGPLPTTLQLAALPVRRFVFERRQNMWAINGQFRQHQPAARASPLGSMEIWELSSIDNGWDHPIHIHFEEGRILSKTTNGRNVVIPAHERGRKDIWITAAPPSAYCCVFADYKGKYVMHCHNLIQGPPCDDAALGHCSEARCAGW